MSQVNLKKALIDWCNNNLKLGVTWPGHFNPGLPCTMQINNEYKKNKIKRDGKLIYQDGTSCSAGHVYHDVYHLNDGTYQIYTDAGFAISTGGDHENLDVPSTNHKDIIEMMMYLV